MHRAIAIFALLTASAAGKHYTVQWYKDWYCSDNQKEPNVTTYSWDDDVNGSPHNDGSFKWVDYPSAESAEDMFGEGGCVFQQCTSPNKHDCSEMQFGDCANNPGGPGVWVRIIDCGVGKKTRKIAKAF